MADNAGSFQANYSQVFTPEARNMRHLVIIVLSIPVLLVSGCSDTSHYPVSGEECGPDDPVMDLTASDLVMPCAVR